MSLVKRTIGVAASVAVAFAYAASLPFVGVAVVASSCAVDDEDASVAAQDDGDALNHDDASHSWEWWLL